MMEIAKYGESRDSIEIESPKGRLRMIGIKNNEYMGNMDGEFDELNHEIYEFIHQCLNTDDSDLLFPTFEEQLQSTCISNGSEAVGAENKYIDANTLQENGESFKFGFESENSSQCVNLKQNENAANSMSGFSVTFENTFDFNGILLKASFLGKTEVIKSCLDNGADVLYTDKVGRTALHYASACGWLPTMKLLLKYNCDINRRDHKQWTALHIAVSKKFPEIVELLLSSGADLNLGLPHTCAPCRGGPISSKAIHFAAIRGNRMITETLIKYGADINDKDEDGKTPLHYASFRPNSDYIKWLIEKGADVNGKDKYGRTPLHVASLSGNLEITKILVDNGSQIQLRDIWDMSPLSLASTREHPEMVAYLELISGEKASEISVIRGFELDAMESIVLNTIITGLQEPKKEFLARVIKTLGAQRSLQLYENAMKIENSGGLLTADRSRKKTIGGVFCHLLKQLVSENKITMQEWNYIRQEEKERINAKNILKRNNRRSQV
ncbi:ankyrin-repeat protein [Cryptosporidium ubiquitum]|uniref:Ankyrin-repeat protein n=1 Tax=Cryptosporidium ubiquitum TaxID=857276 RepID=A0A1J4MH84_9CRYT|nr:ankyrin-repeat protein [Cryptosporidium ubiquitum]OII73367.1 ankyrin-repeat protein [Cryptosporidium ubiquitum]